MAIKRRCARCVYLLHPTRVHPLRETMEPQLVLPLCLNHAGTPGEVREVHPCECCRNFEARHETSLPPVPADPEVKYIPLGGDQFAIVDAADFEWLKRYDWRFLGGEGGRGYAYRVERGQKIFMHREIMQTPPGQVAHHENHNPINNRRGNLRNCRPQENQHHRRRPATDPASSGSLPKGRSGGQNLQRGRTRLLPTLRRQGRGGQGP